MMMNLRGHDDEHIGFLWCSSIIPEDYTRSKMMPSEWEIAINEEKEWTWRQIGTEFYSESKADMYNRKCDAERAEWNRRRRYVLYAICLLPLYAMLIMMAWGITDRLLEYWR